MEKETQRRLTAIVAANISGFSRLVGPDEVGTIFRATGEAKAAETSVNFQNP